jgi:hypothetical protein
VLDRFAPWADKTTDASRPLLSLYLMGGGPSTVANVDTQNKISLIKIPQIPTAASANDEETFEASQGDDTIA